MRHKRIPGKKHKGFKDPEAQHAKRFKELSKKINATPNNVDEQAMPKKLRLMINAKNNYLEKQRLYKERKNAPIEKVDNQHANEDPTLLDSTKHMGYEMNLPGMYKPLKPIPVFKQMPGEGKKQFFRRMDVTVQAVMKRKQYEDKFDVDVTDDPTTGTTKVTDRVKDEVDLEVEKIKNKKRGKKRKVVKTKEEKRVLKREKDKERKRKKKHGVQNDNAFDFDDAKFSDKVKFNEVVHAPPENLKSTKIIPKVGNYNERKPGKKNNLILSQKLNQETIMSHKSKTESISLARKCMLEEERIRVIEQYRKNKKKNS